MLKKEYNTPLAKAVHDGVERHLEYFYNNVLKKWSKHYRESEHQDYDSFKKYVYTKYIDWEAEFCAALAEKIEREIIEKIRKDETN